MELSEWNDSTSLRRQSGQNPSTFARDNNLPSSLLHNDNTNNNKEQQCNRNYLLQQDVQAVVSENGKEKIQSLLEQVYGLLPIEQLLLYLKLPTEQSASVDPLRQSMNPLGSRSEINQTITWIQTHLEEDKELSLQKKGVYDDYVAFCEPNGIKPLSTADFGKVMKQVYPNVRPRRLGTRGQSKYCYSGLRSRVKLDAPLLPDLADKMMSTESNCTQSDYMAAAWYIIKEWAEEKLSMQFTSAISLAYYLVKELSIAIGSEAAQLVTTLATTATCNVDNTHYGYISKHKETTIQLQRKIQQTKETKRKQHIQSEKGEKFRSKKFKSSPPSTSCSTSPIVQIDNKDEFTSSNCDSANHSLPDFDTFHRSADTTFAEKEAQPPSQSKVNSSYSTGKASETWRTAKQSPSKRKGHKYKILQPKPDYCDIGSFDSKELVDDDKTKRIKQKIKKEEPLSFFPNEVSDPYFSRERLESVSQVAKDALDEYLGTSNSQEQEEEIIKYLGNEEETKLTQLRELLVQNCPSSSAATKSSRKQPSKPVQNIKAKRRVSFDTHVQDDGFRRRDDVNFIPISSPTEKHFSSANVSPFVSPRNTPIGRRGHTHLQQNKPKCRAEKVKRPHLDLKLNQETRDFRHQLVNLPMSAPPSPKTYTFGGNKFYPNAPTTYPPHLIDDANKLNINAFRSQSVPVNVEQNQMFVFNYPPAMDLARDITDLNDPLSVNEMMNEMETMPSDLHMFPSRSVPNTPVPYNHTVDFQPFEKTNVNSKSYPTTPLASETFTYGQGGHDYLLNGQPIKAKASLGFIQRDDANSMYSGYSDGDICPIDANKNVNVVGLEQSIADCGDLINKSHIDDLFKVVPD